MHGLTMDEWKALRASLKTSSRDRPLPPGDVAALLNKALEQCSLPELAAALEFKDQSTLRKIANLQQLETHLLTHVTWGARKNAVSMSTAVELLRIPSPNARADAFDRAREYGLSRSEARALVRRTALQQSPQPKE